MKAGGLWQFSVKNDWRQQAEILKAKDFQEKTIKEENVVIIVNVRQPGAGAVMIYGDG